MKIKALGRKKKKKISIEQGWEMVNPNAAAIDIGSREHWVAIPPDRKGDTVRCYGAATSDLQELGAWLKEEGVTSVALEATGVYWIAPMQILERMGFKVILVHPRQIKNVSGRKTDVLDCQWIQRLHSYGLLGASFRPADPYCVVRSYMRYRDELTTQSSLQIQHMQKALLEMNLQLGHVISDITGESGIAIIEGILAGERNPLILAEKASQRIKASKEKVAKALVGDYRKEHLFKLRMGHGLYLALQTRITECEQELLEELEKLPDQVDIEAKPLPPRPEGKKMDQSLRGWLYKKIGVDLTAVEGIGANVALTFLTEVGPNLEAFPTEKHFVSWLGLCPDNRVSGGKVLSSRTRPVLNRLSDALRLSATSLERSQSALGAYYRRMKARLGAAEGVTATAHKLARILYRLVKHGEEYVREGLDQYEKKHKERRLKHLQNAAASLGLQLVPAQEAVP